MSEQVFQASCRRFGRSLVDIGGLPVGALPGQDTTEVHMANSSL